MTAKNRFFLLAVLPFVGWLSSPATAQEVQPERYLEPGSLRLSFTASLEGVFQRLRPGGVVSAASFQSLDKTFTTQGNEDRPWKARWGQSLLTEVATRASDHISGRALFETQGEYADRFWRPININNDTKRENENVIFRELEGRIDQELWYLHGFQGIARPGWDERGDFFRLYPGDNPERGYLGSSDYFGVYPQNWNQDQYLNISQRSSPRGGEFGFQNWGWDGSAAYGDELSFGNRESFYGRLRAPIKKTQLTFVYKDEDVPFAVFDEDERNRAYSLSWLIPFEEGHRIETGVLYNPFRVGRPYQVARQVTPGTGLLGSDRQILNRTARKEDAYAARLRLERYSVLFENLWIWFVDLYRGEILAGNREQLDLGFQTSFFEYFQGNFQYTYRRPVEGPVPFLFEGTPDNIGAVASAPRGPEAPFRVDSTNREAILLVTTLQYDQTPGTSFLIFDQNALALWNMNPEENAGTAFAVQHRMTDYRTATDRQYFFDEQGTVVFESAASPGAFPTRDPLHEFRFLTRGQWGKNVWILGVAGGQTVPVLGVAFSGTDPATKPITEYFSIEGRWERWPFAFWGHFGSGVWGPEDNIHPFFGLSYDRLFGVGVSYNITRNTTWDINYLATRQDDDLFRAPTLGSFDEIRTVFSHRFGFLFQFQSPSRRGYKAP